MLPLIRSMSSLEMARPSPLPPRERASEPSAWENFWKMRSWKARSIPGPLSVTEIRTVSSAASMSIRTSASVGDNFRARTLATEGNLLVVTGFHEDYGSSPKGVVYDISNPANPVLSRVVDIANTHA